jgi:hypothetical protein
MFVRLQSPTGYVSPSLQNEGRVADVDARACGTTLQQQRDVPSAA